MTKDIRKIVGKNIQGLRCAQKVSQEAFAESVLLSASSLSDIENGKSYPRPAKLAAIAAKLGVEPYELYFENGARPIFDEKENSFAVLNGLIEKNKGNELFIAALRSYAELLVAYKKKK